MSNYLLIDDCDCKLIIKDTGGFLLITDIGSDITKAAINLTSSTYYGSLYRAHYGCDDNTGTYWASTISGMPQWYQVQFAQARVIQGLKITARVTPYHVQAPTAFALLASNTGSFGGEEVTLSSQSGLTWSSSEQKSWEFVSNTTPYSYYRLNMTAVGSGSQAAFVELELIAPVDEIYYAELPCESGTGSDETTGGSASASTSLGGYPASAAIDDDIDTGWISNAAMPQWWQIDCGSSVLINRLILTNRNNVGYYDQAPLAFVLDGSNTGSFGGEETELLNAPAIAAWNAASEARTWDFVNESAFRYYRITVSENQEGTNYIAFFEIELKDCYSPLSANDIAHVNTLDNISLLQTHILTVQNINHSHEIDNIVLPSVGISNISHSQILENVTLDQIHNISIHDSANTQQMDNINLFQVHDLIIQDVSHNHILPEINLAGMSKNTNMFFLL